MDKSFGSNLKRVLSEKGLKHQALADMTGIKKDVISSYTRENGRKPLVENLMKISNALKVSPNELLGIPGVKMVPIVGNASCGAKEPNMRQDKSYTYYNGEYWTPDLYCMVASGESMAPEIEDGDEIVLDPKIEPQNGDFVRYIIDDESAIKIYVVDEEGGIIQFVPYNPSEDFKVRTISLNDKETLDRLVIHKVVSVNKLKFNNRRARLRQIGRA